MRYFVTISGEEHAIDVSELPGGGFDVRLLPKDADPNAPPTSGQKLDADVIAHGRQLSVRIAGKVFDLVVDGDPPELDVFASGRRATVRVESARMRAASAVRSKGATAGEDAVVSPMPGKVVKVLVKEGDEVSDGSPLVVVEAMKMENELVASRAGTVQKVYVKPGDAVEGGARLVSIG